MQCLQHKLQNVKQKQPSGNKNIKKKILGLHEIII